MKSKFTILGLFLVSLLMSVQLLAAPQVTATVSDTQVVKGDIFILTIAVNDNDDDYQLDTRALEHEFTVFRPAQSQSTEYINGKFSQRTQWQVRMQAKKSGTFTIPALNIGDLTTIPIEIKVIEPSQVKATNNDKQRKVFIENSIDKSDVYIGQSVIFTTKLFLAQRSNSLDLADPHLEGADTSVYGEDKNTQTVRNGIRYNTITRQYKLTPTQAGQFEIDSPLLTGTLRKVVAVNEWQNKAIADPINVRGERLNINVKAVPEDYQGEWLVSDDLRLIEENDLTAQSYKVGDPITRQIVLQIASIDKDKLPNIKLNYPKSLRVYPDQDQLQEGQANGLSYGVRIIKHAIIADKEGTLTLPEIKLNWFNSRTNQAETAILPAQKLTILPAAQQDLNIPVAAQATVPPVEQTIVVDHQALIYWQITVAVLIVIIVWMIVYHLSFRRLTANKQPNKTPVAELDHHYNALQDSLKIHDAPKCYSMLLKYAQAQFLSVKSLSELPAKTALDEPQRELLRHEIEWLQICCSDKSQHWNSNKLAQLITIHESKKSTKKTRDSMNLNP